MFSVLLALCAQAGHTIGSDESVVVVHSRQLPVEIVVDPSFSLPPDWYAVPVPAGIAKSTFQAELLSLSSIDDCVDGAAGVFNVRSITNDTHIDSQWHLLNIWSSSFDINVAPAWTLGYLGSGQIIGIADNGCDQSHVDLNGNYNAALSTPFISSAHGTSVAGIAAAVGDNGLGVAGVAYEAQWSEQLFGSALVNADTFSWANQSHTVKVNAWGPIDDGRLHAMSTLELDALRDAVDNGRGGKGVIFAWAAGNGGTQDRVEYDAYAASRYTIAAGAITNNDQRSYYSEDGSSLLIVAPSDGGSSGIVTTTSSNGYDFNYGGTSASCAMVAGAAALMLEANPDLDWRDVQAIMARTARKCDVNNSEWQQNAAGHNIHYSYGFGALDVGAAVTEAITYVSPIAEYVIDTGVMSVNRVIPDNNAVGITEYLSIAEDITIQHVEVTVRATHNYVGDLEIELVAPSGTGSRLMQQRVDSSDDIDSYTFTSVRHLDESSLGSWKLRIADLDQYIAGSWENWQVKIYGHRDGTPVSLNIAPTSFSAGQVSTIEVSGGLPLEQTYMAYSFLGLGSRHVPQLDVTLGLNAPALLGAPGLSDGLGNKSWSIFAPASSSGRSYWLQALQYEQISNIDAGVVQ
ncbi:MAG: subtilisin-like proprotein convertase family protein [Myxococcota bacterium]|jgi:subtilisin-like proprotein convertase family protein